MILTEFKKSWDNAKKSIFRLEALYEYRVEEDLINFEKFKNGLSYIANKERAWFTELATTRDKGISIQRVRVVSLPFSDYLKYEIDFWRHSAKQGEQILFLKQKGFQKLTRSLDFKPKDFWIFDDQRLIIFHYSTSGKFIKEEIIQDKDIIDKHIKLKEVLIKHSTPMDEYVLE